MNNSPEEIPQGQILEGKGKGVLENCLQESQDDYPQNPRFNSIREILEKVGLIRKKENISKVEKNNNIMSDPQGPAYKLEPKTSSEETK
jgi:hypothetical protein